MRKNFGKKYFEKMLPKMKSENLSGYFTIEASFLMGWVVFLMVLIIYLTFFLYDKCILFQDTYGICFRASVMPVSNSQKVAYIHQNWGTQKGSKYFALSSQKYNVVEGKNMEMTSEIVVEHPFGTVDPVLTGNHMSAKAYVKVYGQNPAQYIRMCRKIKGLF